MDGLTIGKLAEAAGVGVETIRFYERKGILKRPQKGEGYRRYPAEEAARIRFVKRAQDLGFTLREIKELLDLRSRRKVTGEEVRRRAMEKVEEIRGKIADLGRMETALLRLARVCGAGEQAIRECRVFDCFEKDC